MNLIKHLTALLLSITALSAAIPGARATGRRIDADVTDRQTAIRKTSFPQEKVYLHFDNTSYYPDDKIWFKCYVVDATTNRASKRSATLYVELLNPGGKVIEKKILRITDGQCHGDFTINHQPFYSGFYEVRAYTRYMMNFGDDVAFSRVFPVFDRPSKTGDYTERRIARNTNAKYGTLRPKTKRYKKIQLQFYPEGGNMIAGVPARVAFEARGRDGLTDDWRGRIIDAVTDSTVTNFAPTADGRGVLSFTPRESAKYKAKVTYDGKEHEFDLPPVMTGGLSLSVDNISSPDTARVTIRKPHNAPAPEVIGITVSSHGIVYFADIIQPDTLSEIFIAKRKAPDGVSVITLSNIGGNVIADRMLFVDNGKHGRINVSSDKADYLPTEKVGMELTVTDHNGKPVSTPLSLSVTDADNAVGNRADILSGLLLSSEIKGYVPNPSRYFSDSNPDRHIQLDLLMMTQGWRRYAWKGIPYDKADSIRYRPEKAISVNGRVVSFVKGVPKPDVTLSTMIKERNAPDSLRHTFIETFTTDSSGRFAFDCDVTGQWDLVMSSREKGKKKDYRIMLDRLFSPAPRSYCPEELQLNSAPVVQADSMAVTDSIDSETGITEELTFAPDGKRTRNLDEVVVKARRHSREDDIRHNRATSVAYYDMADELNDFADNGQYVGQDLLTVLRKINPNFSSRFDASGWEKIYYKGRGTLFVIDYQPTHDEDSLNYTYLYLESIKSIYINEETSAKLRYADPIKYTAMNIDDYYGCAVFIETDPDKPAPPGKGTRRTVIEGYSIPAEFYHPDYSVMPENEDYRRTLYWNPDLHTDADGKVRIEFYNNMTCRKMSVDAQGITPSGFISTSAMP